MLPPLTIQLPDGLELVMWPRPPKRNKWGQVIVPGETKGELYVRMAASLRNNDFAAIAKVYSVKGTPDVSIRQIAKAQPPLNLYPPRPVKAAEPAKSTG